MRAMRQCADNVSLYLTLSWKGPRPRRSHHIFNVPAEGFIPNRECPQFTPSKITRTAFKSCVLRRGNNWISFYSATTSAACTPWMWTMSFIARFINYPLHLPSTLKNYNTNVHCRNCRHFVSCADNYNYQQWFTSLLPTNKQSACYYSLQWEP